MTRQRRPLHLVTEPARRTPVGVGVSGTSSASSSTSSAPLLEALSQPAVILDADHHILNANCVYRDRFNNGDLPCGQLCHEISHHMPVPCHQTGEECPLNIARCTGQPAQSLHLHHDCSGKTFERVSIYPINGAADDETTYLEIISPTTIACARPEKATQLIGHSGPFLRLLNLISRVAPTSTTVLLNGESGTGKELVARALHRMSSRSNRAFVPVECSGLSETLIESELFGHEKGSFTGAHSRKTGLVEAADGGTLFLDEIGDIPLSLQVKLLRLLETGLFRRVGSVRQIHSDFRLVCATHRNLQEMIAAGEFREDLYYRISAFPVALPSLRERPEDLQPLCECIFERLGCQDRCQLDPEAIRTLEAYPFPGNVRELHNLLERACLLADDGVVRTEHLPHLDQSNPPRFWDVPFAFDSAGVLPIEEVESRYLRWLIHHFTGSRAELAQRLGISERTLYRKLQDH